MIKLQSRTKHYQVFNIPHAYRCTGSKCHCSRTEIRLQETLPDGSRGTRAIPRTLCTALTILGGATSEELPDEVQRAPEVKAALDRRALRLIQLQEQPKPAAPPAPAPSGGRSHRGKS